MMIEKYISIGDKYLTISIPKDALVFAVLNSEYADQITYNEKTQEWDKLILKDQEIFIKDLVSSLVQERENGSSILSDCFDKAFKHLIEYGNSEGIEIND